MRVLCNTKHYTFSILAVLVKLWKGILGTKIHFKPLKEQPANPDKPGIWNVNVYLQH